MRFIFVSFSKSVYPEIAHVSSELQSFGHRTVYWLGSAEPTTFIDENGKSGIIDDDVLCSLPLHTVLNAHDLAMMSDKAPSIFGFLQRTYPHYGLPELERRYHLLLRYAKWLLESLHPDTIVFRTIPNMPPLHSILYGFAHGRGIKTIIFCDTWVSHRVLAMDDFVSGILKENSVQENNSHISLSELPHDLKEYYNIQTADSKEGAPIYISHIIHGHNFTGRIIAAFKAFRQAWRFRLLKKMWRTFIHNSISWFSSRLSNALPRAYRRLSSKPDFRKPFIYFPLHFQPELSTNPLGGYFRDQMLALEILVAALPKEWNIYVKEHPTQWSLGGTRYTPYRPKDFYSSMARFPSVKLIPIDTDSFELIRSSKAVATISGTAGFEAVLRGKPSLIFGYPWFQHAPGVYRVEDLSSCKEALWKIEKGDVPSSHDVLRFLKRLDEVSFRGCLDLEYRSNPAFFKIKPKEQAERILESILKNINE